MRSEKCGAAEAMVGFGFGSKRALRNEISVCFFFCMSGNFRCVWGCGESENSGAEVVSWHV